MNVDELLCQNSKSIDIYIYLLGSYSTNLITNITRHALALL